MKETNINTLKKPIKVWKGICVICGKEFEYEEVPNLGGYAPVKERNFCSDKCINIRRGQMYKARFDILPLKFRDIVCDRDKLVTEGIYKSMFITGAVGVGKTVLMAGIVKEILRDPKKQVKWISYPSFIMQLQSMFNRDGATTPFEEAEEIAEFKGTLAIDDIGAEKMTDFVRQITYYIINNREQECLQTLITSNFSLQEIDNQIDSRISSRIGGMCKIVRLEGKDRRLQK